jgi:hypothetical protein
MNTDEILKNTFFAFFHSIGDVWLLVWSFGIVVAVVFCIVYLIVRR